MGFEARTVQRPRQQVEDQIREAILNGVLKTGQKLPTEVALAADFGVSRSTVREALRALVTDGLIEKVPGAGGGSFVRLLDHHAFGDELGQDIEKLLRAGVVEAAEPAELRRLVEGACVRLAASRRSAEALDELSAVVTQRESLASDGPRVEELDERFHELIGQAAGNRLAAALVRALYRVTEPVGRLSQQESRKVQAAAQQAAILRAVRSGDPDAAEAAMLEHLSYLGDSGK
ncbi:MAG TPA: FadR/GntR family transcriptional regulator [Pseudonocardia sp.]